MKTEFPKNKYFVLKGESGIQGERGERGLTGQQGIQGFELKFFIILF